MPNRPHRSTIQAAIIPGNNNKPPHYILDYYTPGNQPPTRPGWYFCVCADRRLCYLYWRCGSFWDGKHEAEVVYWVELPPFVETVLTQSAPTASP